MRIAVAHWREAVVGGPVEALAPKAAFNGIAVVGKAPGAVEAIEGVPFAGPSGRLLTKILAHAGIDRDAILLANAFRHQPGWTVTEEGRRRENDESLFFTDRAEMANERLPPYHGRHVLVGLDEDVRILWRTLRDIKPKVIVACGAVASWALTGRDNVANVAGNFLDTRCVDAPVMVTYHPAYALRREDEHVAMRIVEDFAKARDRIGEQTPQPTP